MRKALDGERRIHESARSTLSNGCIDQREALGALKRHHRLAPVEERAVRAHVHRHLVDEPAASKGALPVALWTMVPRRAQQRHL